MATNYVLIDYENVHPHGSVSYPSRLAFMSFRSAT